REQRGCDRDLGRRGGEADRCEAPCREEPRTSARNGEHVRSARRNDRAEPLGERTGHFAYESRLGRLLDAADGGAEAGDERLFHASFGASRPFLDHEALALRYVEPCGACCRAQRGSSPKPSYSPQRDT